MPTEQQLEMSAQMARSNALQIQLNKKNKIWTDTVVQKKALDTYTEAQIVSPLLTYETAVQGSAAVTAQSVEAERAIAVLNLQRIVGGVATNYAAGQHRRSAADDIVDQLSDTEVSQMNAFFPDIYRELRRTTNGAAVTPAVFVGFLRRYLSSKAVPVTAKAAAAMQTEDPVQTAVKESAGDMAKALDDVDAAAAQYPNFHAQTVQVKASDINRIIEGDPAAKKFVTHIAYFKDGYTRTKLRRLTTANLTHLRAMLGEHGFAPSADEINAEKNFIDSLGMADVVTKGSGLSHQTRRVIYGSGVTPEMAESKRFYVDMKLLAKGQLAVKYTKNRQFKIRPVPVSKDTAAVVADIIKHNFEPRLYEALSAEGKKVVQFFVQSMGLEEEAPIDTSDVDKLFRDWEIYRGLWIAGNTSPEIRRDLRRHTMQLLQIKRINDRQGMQVLNLLAF